MTVVAPASARDFAALALGVLLEHVGTAAGDLTRLRAELQSALPAAPLASATDLSRTSAELERLGWLFGVLARELGSDVLFERRERDGLKSSLWLVQQVLAREGIELGLPNLPALDSNDERCATLCAVVARCVHAALIDDPRTDWSVRGEGAESALCFDGEPKAGLESALREGELRLSGSVLRRENGSVHFCLPAGSTRWS